MTGYSPSNFSNSKDPLESWVTGQTGSFRLFNYPPAPTYKAYDETKAKSTAEQISSVHEVIPLVSQKIVEDISASCMG
jgi:hypothetical protein